MMAISLETSTQLIALPLEIVHLILDYTSKRELKSLRRTNKFLHKLITPVLFKSFNVYPHVRSFENLINISESPHLGPLIQSLRYDAGYIGVTDMIVRRLQNVYTATLTDEEKKSILEHARHLHRQSLTVDEGLDEMALMSYLEKAFTHLRNLRHIEVWDAFGNRYLKDDVNLPSFYAQLAGETCGRSPHTRLERGMIGAGIARVTYVRTLLMALHKLKSPLSTLVLHRVRWPHLLLAGDLSKHSKFWEKSFASLRSLELATSGDPVPIECISLSNLQTLLKPAVNLEELSISFQTAFDVELCGPDMKDPDSGMVCRSVFHYKRTDLHPHAAPLRLTWSDKLRKLRLDGLVCTMKELKTILKQSASTLRRFELQDFVLMPNAIPGNRACLVELFKWMQKHLQLDEVSLGGFLTNGGMQAWYISRNPGEQQRGLLDQVQSFILKGGVNPLEHVAVAPDHFDLHQKTYSATVPESLHEEKYAGDDTFTLEYADDEEYDEDLEGFSDDDDDLSETEEDDDDDDEEDDDEVGYDFDGLWHGYPMPMDGGPAFGEPFDDEANNEQNIMNALGMPG